MSSHPKDPVTMRAGVSASSRAQSTPATQDTRLSWLGRLSHAVGYSKLYNFWLWFVFSGAFLGFLLARSAYMNFYGVFCSTNTSNTQLHAGPGECFYYLNFDKYYVGLRLHVTCIIIAGFLVLLQFVPAIRHKVRLFHRMNGYLVVLLVLISHAGALMVAPIAFGGSFSTRMFIGFLVILTTCSLFLAWLNIKRLQIDQHRAWMLRAWFYLGTIITERFIFALMFAIVGSHESPFYAMPCDKIEWLRSSGETLSTSYPECNAYLNGSNPNAHALVAAAFPGNGTDQIAAMMDLCFGASLWLALAIHAIGIEVYLQLTPGEAARLKEISYERQLARKFKHPGDAGTTAGRLGDALPFASRSVLLKRDVGKSSLSS